PDAVDPGPQRRILHSHPRTAIPAGQPGSGVRLPVDQRGGAAGQLHLGAQLDPHHAGGAPPARGVRHRHVPRARRLEPVGVRVPARGGQRRRVVCEQSLPIPPAYRAEPATVGRVYTHRADRSRTVSSYWSTSIPTDATRARLLLVSTTRSGGRAVIPG